MPWSGGSYTKGNSGTGGWAGDAAAGIGIEAGRHDTQDNDFATGINQCLNKDGSNAATANLNFGGYLPTNVGAGTAAAPAYCANNDTNTGMFSPGADNIAWATNGSERMRIDNNGKVGIGTTAPANALDINGGSQRIQSVDGVVYTANQFSADQSGARLNLAKSRAATIGTNTIIQSGDVCGSIGFLGANGTGYDYAALIACEIADTPGASGDMPGRIKFYTTPNGSATVAVKFQIDHNGASSFYTSLTGDSTTVPVNVYKTDNVSTAGSNYFVQFYINNGSSLSGRIASNGANAAAFFSTSDANLKENVVDLPPQLSNILALRPVEFDYKDGSGHQIGFIAQEVESIYPDTVYTDPDGIKFLGDMSRNDARLIKAFQELASQVSALEARVAELES